MVMVTMMVCFNNNYNVTSVEPMPQLLRTIDQTTLIIIIIIIIIIVAYYGVLQGFYYEYKED
jgi:hypothetical protein